MEIKFGRKPFGLYSFGMGGSGGGGGKKPFQFSDRDASELVHFVENKFGFSRETVDRLVMGRSLMSFIGKRMEKLGLSEAHEYLGIIRCDAKEFSLFSDEVVIKETQFFRHPAQLRLFEKLLPEFWASNRYSSKLSIWCAACSTGEEPYSLAMLLREDKRFSGWKAKIIATDISGNDIDFADRGRYPKRAGGRITDEGYRKVFDRYMRTDAHGFIVEEVLKNIIEFKVHNLLNKAPGVFDMIFCRNVLMYMDKKVMHQVAMSLKGALTDNGIVFLGGSESLYAVGRETNDHFEEVRRKEAEHFAYRKVRGKAD